MKRQCTILERSKDYNRAIAVDLSLEEGIMRELMENTKYRKKLDYIFRKILEQPNMYFEDYKKIAFSKNETITEMRLFPNGDNCRIYCKETILEESVYCVIMAVYLEKKKSQKIDKRIQQIIDKIKTYKYELYR